MYSRIDGGPTERFRIEVVSRQPDGRYRAVVLDLVTQRAHVVELQLDGQSTGFTMAGQDCNGDGYADCVSFLRFSWRFASDGPLTAFLTTP